MFPLNVVATGGNYRLVSDTDVGQATGYDADLYGELFPAQAPVLLTGALITFLGTLNGFAFMQVTLDVESLPNTNATFQTMTITGGTPMDGDYNRNDADYSTSSGTSRWGWNGVPEMQVGTTYTVFFR